MKTLDRPACIKDSALRYLFCNDAYARMMRRPAADFIGWGSYQLTGHADDIDREDKERRALVFGSDQSIACHIDGRSERSKLHCERFIAEDGQIYLYEVFDQIIETPKDKPSELTLLDALPLGVMLVDRYGRIEYANAACSLFFGDEQRQSLSGKSVFDYLNESDVDNPFDGSVITSRSGHAFSLWARDYADGKKLLCLVPAEAKASEEAPSERSETKVQLRRLDGAPPSILTIGGSDESYRELLDMLGELGVDAHHAVDGELGCAILREARSSSFPIDMVIIDHRQQSFDAQMLAKSIRNIMHPLGTHIVLLTEASSTPHVHSPFDGHLSGPVSPQDVQPLWETLLTSVKRPDEAELSQFSLQPDILIADNDEINQIIFSQVLSAYDLNFRIVQNGAQAFEAWRRQRPSLIFLSTNMGDCNGYEAAKLIRKAEIQEGLAIHTPIIGICARGFDYERERCFSSGMDDVLTKPISPNGLMAKVSHWLHHQLGHLENTIGSRQTV